MRGGFEMERKKITSILLSCVLATSMFQVTSTQKTYAASDPVSVWLTKADQSKLLLPQTNVAFSADSGTNDHTINVNENITYQQMDGFGASLTDSSAWLIQNKLSTAARDTLMTNLFDKTNGIGISLLRQTIGACDYSRNIYSYDDMPSGQTDDNLTNFSIDHDNEYIVPLLEQALQKNSSIKIMASPWSPPGWMKSSGSMIGGTLNTSAYNAYANYFVKYINAYKALGLPIYAVTVQNEPEYVPPNYPGMLMSASEQANFIKNNLGPTFKANNISTKIIAYDHNFNHPEYPLSVLGDSGANPYVAGTAWHLYAGSQEAMTTVHNAYPTKDNWFTEGSGGSWAGDGSWHDSFNEHMAKAIRVTRNWSKSVVWWNMALDENNGPSVLDKSTCYGVVTVNQTTGEVSYNADYYTLGQFSKFVDSGAYRIESNSFENDIEDVAFKNPDGSKVLVVNNINTVDKSVKVKWGSESVTYTIPADSAITFKWSGSQSGSQINVKPAWYQNFETGSGFTAGTNGVVATDSSSANTGGSKSVKLTTSISGDPGRSAQCVNVIPNTGTPFDASPYSYLNFYVKDTQGVNTVKLTFVDKNNAEYSTWTTRSAKNQWTPINFSLSSITGIDTTAIKEVRVGEWNPGVYYFDDFYFSADSTFVTPTFGVDKTVLSTAIGNATTLMGSKTVGTAVGNVPQAAKDAFQNAIDAAIVVNGNTAATQAEEDAQIAALRAATTNFNNAVIGVPAKWFQNFSGGDGFSPDTKVTTEVATDHANITDGNSVKMTMSSLTGGYWDNTVDNTKNIKITPMGQATFDATNYSYLIFYVKDMAGSNNNIHIKMKDNQGATWNFGTNNVNDMNRATPHFGVQGTWTKIVVTLDKTQALDWSKISEISIQEYWNYSNVYYFDDLYFAQNSTNNPPVVNKAVLTTAIGNATTLIGSKTVGVANGNVPQGAKDDFQSVITAAGAVNVNTAATQVDVNDQIEALAIATTNFNSAVIVVNKAALLAAISDATTLIGGGKVGAANGNVPKVVKNYFQSVINVAKKVNENEAASQLEVDAQVTAIATATTNFKNWKHNMHQMQMFLKERKYGWTNFLY